MLAFLNGPALTLERLRGTLGINETILKSNLTVDEEGRDWRTERTRREGDGRASDLWFDFSSEFGQPSLKGRAPDEKELYVKVLFRPARTKKMMQRWSKEERGGRDAVQIIVVVDLLDLDS